MPSSRRELQGPRPPPLKVSKDSWKAKKLAAATSTAGSGVGEMERREPVVVYLHTPKVIHARPQDFMSLVQRLTGKSSSSSGSSRCSTTSSSDAGHVEKRAGTTGMDSSSLMRDLGGARQDDVAGVGDQDGSDPLLLTLGQFSSMSSVPSPIISPSLFFCSPNSQPSLQDLSPLF